jgi:hypothetical protein
MPPQSAVFEQAKRLHPPDVEPEVEDVVDPDDEDEDVHCWPCVVDPLDSHV